MLLDDKISSLEKRLQVLLGQCDSIGIRLNNCESNINKSLTLVTNLQKISQTNKVQDKPDKKDVWDVKDDLKIFKQIVNNNFAQGIDFAKWSQLNDQVQSMKKTVSEFGDRKDLERRIEERISITKNEILHQSSQINNEKGDSLSKLLKQAMKEIDYLKISVEKDNENMAEKLKLLSLELEKKTDVEFIRQYISQKAVSKPDVKNFMEESKKYYLDTNEETKICQMKIKEFQEVLNKFDYNMLFKASKMEVSELEKSVLQINRMVEESVVENTKMAFTQQENDLQKKSEILNQEGKKILSDFLQVETSGKIRQEVTEYLTSLKLQTVKNDLDQIQEQLQTKAPWSQLVSLENSKQSKERGDLAAMHNTVLQKYFKFTLLNVLTFIGLFDSADSLNMKKSEIRKTYKEVEAIYQKIATLNPPTVLNKKLQLKRLLEPQFHRRLNTQNDDSPQQYMNISLENEKLQTLQDVNDYTDNDQNIKGRMLSTTRNSVPQVKLKPLLINKKKLGEQ